MFVTSQPLILSAVHVQQQHCRSLPSPLVSTRLSINPFKFLFILPIQEWEWHIPLQPSLYLCICSKVRTCLHKELLESLFSARSNFDCHMTSCDFTCEASNCISSWPTHSGGHSTGARDVDCCWLQEAVQGSVEGTSGVRSAVWGVGCYLGGCGVLWCSPYLFGVQSDWENRRIPVHSDTIAQLLCIWWRECPCMLPLTTWDGGCPSFFPLHMSCVCCNSVEQFHTLYAIIL